MADYTGYVMDEVRAWLDTFAFGFTPVIEQSYDPVKDIAKIFRIKKDDKLLVWQVLQDFRYKRFGRRVKRLTVMMDLALQQKVKTLEEKNVMRALLDELVQALDDNRIGVGKLKCKASPAPVYSPLHIQDGVYTGIISLQVSGEFLV